MKKQTLTKQNIQNDLLKKLNKQKPIAIILTVITVIGLILYPLHLINYLNGTPFEYNGGVKNPPISPTAAMFVIPIVLLFFILLVVFIYYADLYKIKTGKFIITEEKLYSKEKETIMTYGKFGKSIDENALYFPRFRIAVDKEVYSYSKAGDRFYAVTLKSKCFPKRGPDLVYPTKYYEIESY